MDRHARLSPLGTQRLRVLDCLGGNNRWSPGYFEPDADTDIFVEFRRYVRRTAETWGGEADPSAVSLIAAARLLTGDLAAAQAIVDNLPGAPLAPDHGAGVCAVLPLHVLRTALPVPPALADTTRWLAGSAEQVTLRAWLSGNGGTLQWREADGIYAPAGDAAAPVRSDGPA